MAESEQDERDEQQPTKPSRFKGVIVLSVIALTFGGAGLATPLLFPSLFGQVTASPNESPQSRPSFVSFGETVVNLDEGRLNRYLRINITLQIDEPDVLKVTELVDENKSILKSWMLSHLSDKGMDEIRGAAGQNRLRREIQDYFNSVMFPDGHDRIHDVLFEEFNVQ